MMKPPFKASDSAYSAINVLRALWFDMCTVWFVASLSCINMTLKYLLCHAHSCNIRLIITWGPLGDYKPDIAVFKTQSFQRQVDVPFY